MVGEVLDVMRELADEGMTMVGRDPRNGLCTEKLLTSVIFMADGSIVEAGTPQQNLR